MTKCANINVYAKWMENREKNVPDHTAICTHVK